MTSSERCVSTLAGRAFMQDEQPLFVIQKHFTGLSDSGRSMYFTAEAHKSSSSRLKGLPNVSASRYSIRPQIICMM